MGGPSTLASVFYGLMAAITWGMGDFSGGFATRRASVVPVMLFSQVVGICLFAVLALLTHEPFPTTRDLVWGAVSGAAGLIGIAALYSAMALGQMGIVAPISGVITAALPVIVGALTQGLPNPLNLLGFALALAGVFLISRYGHGAANPRSIALAIVSGFGFGGFLILIAQAQHGTVFWPLTAARAASITLLLVSVLIRRSIKCLPRAALLPTILAGTMDSGGNLFFVLASQAGRLDVAGVISSLYPATTVLLALTLLHERLARSQVLGVVLALIAIPLISIV
jgi:drug/metabolite transporter (DMT)-like permease